MIYALQSIEKYWFALSLCILLAITALSLWPLTSLPSVPGSDKTHHLMAYAALVFPVALRHPRRWMLFAAFFIAYSGLIELVQPHANRYGEWSDLLANMAGVVCGIALATAISIVRKRRIKR